MKKFLAIILALTCAFALFACGDDAATNNYATDAADFITAIGATDVTTLDVKVSVETAQGTLTSTYVTTYNADGTSTMEYRIETVASLDSEDDIAVQEGTVTCDANGNYSNDEISGKIGATGVSLNLNSDKITSYSVLGDVLTINVAKADTASVIGTALGSDAFVSVTKANGKVVSITLNYTDATGCAVAIVCAYK